MPKEIHLLPDEVINKIAAGEVVERPSSVVKELLENAIDAGATKIEVELEQGGNTKILIRDNGKGIDPDELPMAITRHATSKISKARDLFDIRTMGFRGEALASIAEVCKFTLQSRKKGQDGARLRKVEQDVSITPYNGDFGTSVCIEELFFNVPVRKKFLRTSSTEYAYCLELVQALSIVNPGITFRLNHNEKLQFSSEAICKDILSGLNESIETRENVMRQKAIAVLGSENVEKLMYSEKENDYGRVEVLFSPPGLDKPTSKSMYFFTNGRFVKDKSLRLGVQRGYHSHILKNRFPQIILNLQIDPSLVDVNAHPSKTELRFQYPGEIQALIALAIRDLLRKGDWAIPNLERQGAQSSRLNPNNAFAASNPAQTTSPSYGTRVEASRTPSSFATSTNSSPEFTPSIKTKVDRFEGRSHSNTPQLTFNEAKPEKSVDEIPSWTNNSFSFSDESPVPVVSNTVAATVKEPRTINWQELEFVGCFNACYLFFETPDKQLLAVDQHAFHERILFEKLMEMDEFLVRSQPMLVPENCEFEPVEVSTLRTNLDKLKEFGFDLEFISDSEVEIKAVPNLLQGRNFLGVLKDIAKDSIVEEKREELRKIHGHIVETMACHAAVRSGEHLMDAEREHLLKQADGVDFFHNCPHGRRVLRFFSKSEVGRWFDRL